MGRMASLPSTTVALLRAAKEVVIRRDEQRAKVRRIWERSDEEYRAGAFRADELEGGSATMSAMAPGWEMGKVNVAACICLSFESSCASLSCGPCL